MGWSSAFLTACASSILRPRFLLETVEGSGFDPGPTLKLSSHPTPGYRAILGPTGSASGALMALGDWSCSFTEITLPLIADVRRDLARGQLMVLRVGWPGWAEGDYEPVFRGHVVSLVRSGLGEDWSLSLRSVVSALTSRMSQSAGNQSLFASIASSTVATDYTAGDATIEVTDASAAVAEGSTYLLQVVAGGADPFFVTATLAGDTFTLSPTTGLMGTATADAAAGDEVVFCALVLDNPVAAARKILTSTGAGTNGPSDTLPADWGLALPASFLDDDDCDHTRDVVEPDGAGPYEDWHVHSTEPQADALSWLLDVLSPAGIILCERQGCLTIRAVSPADTAEYETDLITDAHIVSIERSQTWDTSSPIEYGQVLVRVGDANVGSADPGASLDSRPTVQARQVDLDHVHASVVDTSWQLSVIGRIQPWSTRVPEVVEIVTIGLRFAGLAPCDSVRIRSRFWTPRDGAEEPTLMVLGVAVDWWGNGVRITAAYHPPTGSEF